MERKTITAEQIKNAPRYIPIAEKTAYAKLAALACIESVPNTYKDGDITQPMPDRYQESYLDKSLALMSFFVSRYLQQGDKDSIMSTDEYDDWASSMIFNQLERLKGDQSIRDKVFDIIFDYKDFEKRLNGEIYSLLGHKNDPTARLMLMMTAQSTPEALEQQLAQLKTVGAEIERFAAERGVEKQEGEGN